MRCDTCYNAHVGLPIAFGVCLDAAVYKPKTCKEHNSKSQAGMVSSLATCLMVIMLRIAIACAQEGTLVENKPRGTPVPKIENGVFRKFRAVFRKRLQSIEVAMVQSHLESSFVDVWRQSVE